MISLFFFHLGLVVPHVSEFANAMFVQRKGNASNEFERKLQDVIYVPNPVESDWGKNKSIKISVI